MGFRLLEPIARGGLSTVWRARHTSGMTVAVKLITPSAAADDAIRFRDEIRAVAALNHPNIVRVIDLGHAEEDLLLPGGHRVRPGTPWLAMEYVGGGTLGARHVRDWDTLAWIIGALLQTLAHAHARGIVHRDLKPANVLLVDSEDPKAGLKLTDFGIAFSRPDSRELGPTGTIDYMAPEQVEVEVHKFGPWTDLYGLGCLLFEIATGVPPFRDGDKPLAIAHLFSPPPPVVTAFARPDGFEPWLHRLLAKEPHERFRSAAEAAEALFGPSARRLFAGRPQPQPIVGGAGLRLFGLRDIPLVGRKGARGALTGALAEAAGGPVALTLRGAAGVGRTRLLRWFEEYVAETGEAEPVVFRPAAGGDELTAAIVEHTNASGLEGPELREHLEWWSGDAIDPLVRRELARVLVPDPDRRVDAADRPIAVGRWLSALAGARRVVVLVDDADACPEALLVAREVLADPGKPPILVVLALSDEVDPEKDPELARLVDQAREVRLPPLAREDRLVLLQRALSVEPTLAARIDEETGGSTLVAIELLRDHVERGWLVPSPEGLVLAPGRDVVVPQDRFGPWVSRTQRAVADDPEAAVQLELAAALGEEVALDAWEAVGGQDADAVRALLLDRLLSGHLAESTSSGFRFAHPMARAAVLRQARLYGRYKTAQRTCLVWAQATGASADRIARHLVALESWDEAVTPLLDAAEERQEREGPGAGWAVLQTAEQALERASVGPADPRRLRAVLLRATLLEQRGFPDRALATLDAAEKALARSKIAARSRARLIRAEAYVALGRIEEAVPLLRENVEAEGVSRRVRLRTFDVLGNVHRRLGRYAEAASWARRSEDLLSGAGDEGLRGVNLMQQAGIAVRRDDLPAATSLLERARPLVEQYGSLRHRAILANERAALLQRNGAFEEAEPLFARAIELARAAGYRPIVQTINLAMNKLERRRFEEAEALLQESGVVSGPPESSAVAAGSLVLAVCHASRGRWTQFDRTLERAAIGLGSNAEPDNVRLLERAEAEARQQGQGSRADRCRELAAAQRDRLAAGSA